MAKERMAKTLREIADALESEVVKPSILKEVEIFITKFPMVALKTSSASVHQRYYRRFFSI